MNLLAKLFAFLPQVFGTVLQVEQDLQSKSGGEKKQAALDALKGAGSIAALADGKDADSINEATQAAGAAIDATVSLFKHTGVMQSSPDKPAPAPLSDAEKAQLASLQARSSAS